MVSLTVSIDSKTYDAVRRYMEDNLLDNMSQAVRMLVKKGIAHELTIRAELQAHKSK